MTYVYAACTVCVTIFSTGGKFQPVSNFTCSYSSRLFLYNLVIDTSKFLYIYIRRLRTLLSTTNILHHSWFTESRTNVFSCTWPWTV